MQDEPSTSPPPDPGATPQLTPLPDQPGPAGTSNDTQPPGPKDSAEPAAEAAAIPPWAKDLRHLYNAVVEEPLPDSFVALLSQLDAED